MQAFIKICFLLFFSFYMSQDLLIAYNMNFRPKKESEERSNEEFYLNILSSENKSVYGSRSKIQSDSLFRLIRESSGERKTTLLAMLPKHETKDMIVKHIGDGLMEQYYYFNTDYYVLERNIPMVWKLQHEDGKKVLGYNCKKAIIDFGGRSWEAWYTPDIPYPDGPYVFSQLPGLILEIKSIDGDYCFQAIGIEKRVEQNFIIPKKSILVKNEKQLHVLKQNYINNPTAKERQEDMQMGTMGYAIVNGRKMDMSEAYKLLDKELWDWMKIHNNPIEKGDLWVR